MSLFMLGATISVIAAAELWLGKSSISNTAKIREVFEAMDFRNKKTNKYPVKLNKDKSDKHLVYELPAGRCPEEMDKVQYFLNSHLKAETEIYTVNGMLNIKVMDENLPKSKVFKQGLVPPEKDEDGKVKNWILPVPIGYSRGGFVWVDLVDLPHLVVAGETRGGKSNFLHQALAVLAHNERVILDVVDLKKVEFGYMQDHANIAMTLPDTLNVLEEICLDMMQRMDFLIKNKVPKIQDLKGKTNLPYRVLVIDEMSQLSPDIAKEEEVKKMRKKAHQMLTDIICLSAALGIHVILSTQRPDASVLPGQLKANIPAALSFAVKNEVNSRIILDNDRAIYLPPIAGRAIWQHDIEREVQVQHLPVWMARKLLPKKAVTKPEQVEQIAADGSM